MPDSLKVHSGERVDLVDYVLGANTYTQESQKFELERMWLDRRSLILDGFRIQVEDQTINPGMITVYNGNAADRTGQLTNNEQVVNDSRSITLLGAGLNFYVEIEFIQNESGTDARFFWDPTIVNTVPAPDGSEFSLNVATRLASDWRIVNPVSTTSFDQTSSPNSIKIPVGVFRTDGANRIVVGGTNPGLTLVTAASVLEVDSIIGQSVIRVVDNRIFPATLPFNVTVDLGGVAPEARTVSSIDRANGLLTLSVNLASVHKAGAIVRVTTGTGMLVKQKTDPSDPALDSLLATPGHPDPAQRLWQANETRGSALTTSKETFGGRDDLGIRSLKDQIDALSAQIRELKFGNLRPDVVATAPPLAFGARPRWFDAAGGVQGARTNSLSIGNGTTSYGDFNVTAYSDASAMLTAAIAALPAAGGTIYVKPGTYLFPSTVTNTKAVVFIGESFANTVFSSTNTTGAAISTTGTLRFVNMAYQRGGGAAVNTLDIAAATNVQFDYSVFTGQIRLVNVNGSVSGSASSFIGSGGAAIVIGSTITSVLTNSRFNKCLVSTAGFFLTTSINDVVIDECYGTCLAPYSLADGTVTRLVLTNNQMTVTSVTAIGAGVTGAVSGVIAENNRFTLPAVTGGTYVFGFWNTAARTDRVHVTNNYFNYTGGTTAAGSVNILLWLKSTQAASDIVVDNNSIDCNVGSFIIGAQLDQRSLTKASFTRNYCNRLQEMVRVGGPVAGMTSCDLEIKSNVFTEGAEHNDTYGIRLLNDPQISRLAIRDNYFVNLGAASGVGTRVAIDLSTASAGFIGGKYEVSGNFCFGINAGNAESSFLRYVPASSNQQDVFIISDNYAESITGPTVATGIYMNPGGTNIANIKIRGNRIDTVGDGVTTVTAYGIFVANQNNLTGRAPSVIITENDVFSVLATGTATGIEVQNCGPTNICHNVVTDVEAVASTPVASATGIRFQSATGSTKGLLITDNFVDQGINTTAVNATHCIVVALASTTLTGFAVDRNHCRSSTSGSNMLYLYNSPAGAFVDGSVSDNTIAMRSVSSSIAALQASLGNGSLAVKLHGNIIQETTYNASMVTHIGIAVTAPVASARCVSVCNNILTGVKTGALLAGPNASRIGIRMRGPLISTVVSNNLVDWNAAGVVVGRGIVYKDDLVGGTWDQHVINGNLVTGDNDAGSGGELDFDITNYRYGYVIGNNVGTATAPGQIVFSATYVGSTWDVGPTTAPLGAGTFVGINKLQ